VQQEPLPDNRQIAEVDRCQPPGTQLFHHGVLRDQRDAEPGDDGLLDRLVRTHFDCPVWRTLADPVEIQKAIKVGQPGRLRKFYGNC
jgi:hypothetical protein